MPADIKLEGKDYVLAKLALLGRLDPVKAGIRAAGIYLKGKLAQYPQVNRLTRAEVYGETFKTARQRRAFFAKLKSGAIEVPYHRGESPGSQRFKARWAVTGENNGMTAVVGNNATYGPLLMDTELQSVYARRVGWRTTDAVIEEERAEVLRIISEAIDGAMED